MDIVMFSVIISKFSYALSASVTVIFTGVVNFIMGYKIKKIDMLGSLKCVE